MLRGGSWDGILANMRALAAVSRLPPRLTTLADFATSQYKSRAEGIRKEQNYLCEVDDENCEYDHNFNSRAVES